MSRSAILANLNPEQKKAVTTIDGPLLVLAGAGTGKTRVITCRIAYMIQQGIAPENILGMTFTNKAAREMKERLAELVPAEQASKVMLGTFHSFCVRLLRVEIEALNYTRDFTIADEGDQKSLIKQAAAELGYSNVIDLKMTASFISNTKNELIDPSQAINRADNEFEVRMAHVYRKYQELLEIQNMIDFDDMLFLVTEIFDRAPDTLKKYQERYRYILVDEYQDTNDAQFKLLKALCGGNNNICVVGDDDQSIYGWRGANVQNILDFPDLFPGTKKIKLEQNYRSTNTILKAANRVISCNSGRFNKNLWSQNGDGEKIKVLQTDSPEKEAEFIADYVMEAKRNNPDLKYSDFAVLYRSNHLSRQLETTFRKVSLPYRLVGGQEFFKRKEVKDAVAYLKLLVNPREDQSLLRIIGVPPRGIGAKAITAMRQLKEQTHKPFSMIIGTPELQGQLTKKGAAAAAELNACLTKYRARFNEPGNLAKKAGNYLVEVGYFNGLQKTYKDLEDAIKRQENVSEFINAIADFEEKEPTKSFTLSEYLESYALLEENDRTKDAEDDGDAVILTTVHAAKGLEFPTVFLIAMERNIFPHEMAELEGRTEEETRLFYVAVTRAKRDLVMTHTASRKYRGINLDQLPSDFLDKLPEELIERQGCHDFFQPVDDEELNEKFEEIFAVLRNRR